VLILGLCGGLAADVQVGDQLVYGEIVHPMQGSSFLCDARLSESILLSVPSARDGVRAVASDGVIERAYQKRDAGRHYNAQAVDMETLPLAASLSSAGALVAALRVASDGQTDDLPELGRAIDGSGGIDGFALALALLRRPLAGARLMRNGPRALAMLERAACDIFVAAAPAIPPALFTRFSSPNGQI